MIKSTITAFLLLFLVTVTEAQVANIGDPRLKIELPDASGKKIALSSLKGKVVLLDFWASWCMPCRSANKQLVKLYAKYKAKGFEIYSVSVDEDKNDWLKAVRKDKITWLQVNDPANLEADAIQRWQVNALPTVFLINKKGDVVAIDIEGKELDNEVARLLAE
ncbi:TlpA family protein disulfide reductase [Terrimonas sp. NA20]|uniref:TlpA family protein disulfide reductase n=1 Tax=Terrimonas ginsenosidimutans TaxID=2908004 RepID=A0ABS9KTB3_9BACT|nr:TlpA disulfide reductase family protein [Terrimonas ginsenosidimutans]MCG2615558.1 TlpA family protein disulfide reductase [Terrimonas ginsenosidimutans]